MTASSLLPLLHLAEALRDRDLAALAREDKKLTTLIEQRQTLDTLIKTARAAGPNLDWPGANERWHLHLQNLAAKLQVDVVQAEGSSQVARARARRSFGRASALAQIVESKSRRDR